MPFLYEFSARLPADLEVKLVHNGLNCLRGTRMSCGMVEHDRQQKGTCMFLNRHPLFSQHHARAAVYLNHVVIIMDQLLRLIACTNSDRLVRIDRVD
jgi:hypothetical protein